METRNKEKGERRRRKKDWRSRTLENDYNEMINSYTEGDLIMLKIKRGRMITYLAFEI